MMLEERVRMNSIRLRLIDARQNCRLSQGRAAALLEIHRPTLSLIEGGGQKLTVELLLRMCDLYEVEPGYILDKKEYVPLF